MLGSGDHSMILLTDALALGDLFATMQPDFSLNDFNTMLEASSNQASTSLEQNLQALLKLFKNDANPIATGDREAFYAKLLDLKKTITDNSYLTLTLASLLTSARDNIATQAKTDFGLFYALQELNPFSISGAAINGIYAGNNLYQSWQKNQALDETDKNYSDAYLADRAAMLLWKLKEANEDIPYDINYTNTSENARFEDKTQNFTLNIGSPQSARYIFGSQTNDEITGHLYDDHLYGGEGNDSYLFTLVKQVPKHFVVGLPKSLH